jgi:RNA polymerase sigma factor (sigma-70 family)
VITTALNFARRQMRKRSLTADPGPADGDAEALIDLRRAVRTLPARQQTAVVLHYLMGLPVSEVAGSMGCKEGTVKAHLARARSALERSLTVDDPSVTAADKGSNRG